MQIKSIFKITVTVALTLVCMLLPTAHGQNQTYDESCNFASNLCHSKSLLYCNNNDRCACVQGTLDSKATLNYTLAWDVTLKTCAAVSGSVCIGTEEHPLGEDESDLRIQCQTGLRCIQTQNYVNTVGQCKTVDSNSAPAGLKIASGVVAFCATLFLAGFSN